MAADQINLADVVIHGSPDVRRWQPTVSIASIVETPATGFNILTNRAVPDSWKWPSNPNVPSDNYQYTVWFFALLAGVWHGGGFVQMWQGRDREGGHPIPPLLSVPSGDVDPGYVNLWGDRRRLWGELSDYVPRVGDKVGIMLTAGNARQFAGVSSVAERSNVVLFPVAAGDMASVIYTDAPVPAPDPTPVDPPEIPVHIWPAGSDIARLESKIDLLNGQVAQLAAMVAVFQARHLVGTVDVPYLGKGQADLVFKP